MYFSIFFHNTYALSVSRSIFSLTGNSPRNVHTAIPSCATHQRPRIGCTRTPMHGTITLSGVALRRTSSAYGTSIILNIHYNSHPHEQLFQFELSPLHSPLLRRSLLFSFPWLNDMLKSSQLSRRAVRAFWFFQHQLSFASHTKFVFHSFCILHTLLL